MDIWQCAKVSHILASYSEQERLTTHINSIGKCCKLQTRQLKFSLTCSLLYLAQNEMGG
jgi:hypothetical protein